MLKLENVVKEYKSFRLDCSMEVKAGTVTGLIGQNGAGKSTTFKAILGLIHTDAGKIEVFGKDVSELKSVDKEEIAVVLSDSGFSGYLTVKDLLPMLDAMYSKFDKVDFVEQCKKFRIPMDKKMKDFSTGMKRKLQLLTALSHDAKLLILDEPTAGLDALVRDQVLDMLRTYMEQEDRAILISSHISSDLENFCDDIYMINDGKIVLHEDTDVLMNEYAILKLTDEQYSMLDKSYLLKHKKETYGYQCLTNEKQFYMENYPDVVVEKSGIDELMMMMIRGEQ